MVIVSAYLAGLVLAVTLPTRTVEIHSAVHADSVGWCWTVLVTRQLLVPVMMGMKVTSVTSTVVRWSVGRMESVLVLARAGAGKGGRG